MLYSGDLFFYAVDHFGSGCLRLLGFAFAQMASPPKRLRLRTKTPPPRRPQVPVVGLALEPREADAKKGRQVYLVTLPHPKAGASTEGRLLVAPGILLKKATLAAFLDCCAHPVYVDPRSIRANLSIPMKYVGVWREFHAEDANGDVHEHDHLAVLAMREFMYLPVKRALRERYGLASHWSCSHVGHWSTIRYLYMTSEKKPEESMLDKNPELWAAPGHVHPPLDECCIEPFCVAAMRERRVKAERQAASKKTYSS